MNILSVSRRAAALAFAAILSACSSTPPDKMASSQQAPGTPQRPILSSAEAQHFVQSNYFSLPGQNNTIWVPDTISRPQKPDFIVGEKGNEGVTHSSIQAAVDAAIIKRSSARQYIAIEPGNYIGTVYIPAASGSITLYGVTDRPEDVKITLSLDSDIDKDSWRRTVNPSGKYMPGKPAWYMVDSCQNRQNTGSDMMCSAVVWSQNNGLQIKNLTIANTLGDSVDSGNHHAVALRSDGDKVQLDNVHLLGRQNTFFVTNSDIKNRMLGDRYTRTLVTNSYIEGDVDVIIGRGAVVFDNTVFQLVNSRTKEGYLFAPATLANSDYGFLVINSVLRSADNGQAKLGRAWDSITPENVYATDAIANGQVTIRDSIINEGFDTVSPWDNAIGSDRQFTGTVATQDENHNIIRNLNDPNANRMWEYNNRGVGSDIENGGE